MIFFCIWRILSNGNFKDLQQSVNIGELSAGHARALLTLDNDNHQRSVFNKIKENNYEKTNLNLLNNF